MDDDIQLLERYESGDREAFDDLVRKHQRPLHAFLYRLVSDQEDAADLLQRTFVKAFTGISGFERRSKFRTWLYQIAVNLVKNHYRDRARAAHVPIDDVVIKHDPGTLEGITAAERREALREALPGLPEKQRITVLLRVREGKKFEEIAGLLNCSVGTAKANYHHGVKNLKRLMGVGASEQRRGGI